ncbi:jg9835 [Pararge aegeria aegeria]|uniref:Jg9835 protein n=1 Tax=Pararge aegeria aegeria TaxID=348720 RepID=A0A8S4QRT3_9NEOP|nr:jg9835 [Pararge aegeria aegeria]
MRCRQSLHDIRASAAEAHPRLARYATLRNASELPTSVECVAHRSHACPTADHTRAPVMSITASTLAPPDAASEHPTGDT